MIFFSHSKKDPQGNTYGSKELKIHIKGVKEKALFHLAADIDLGYSDAEIKTFLEVVVKLHDLGKYTTYFQDYLLKKEPINTRLKQHARIGAFTAFNLLEQENKKALLAFYLIFLHHSSLINFQEVSEKLGSDLQDIINKQKSNLKASSPIVEKDLSIANLDSYINYPDEKNIRRNFKIWQKKEPSIQDYFLINYLFSLLIEGDKLDASDTKPYSLTSIEPLSVDHRFGKAEQKFVEMETLTNNELRNYCRAVVTSHLADKEILNQYIFTLTAPTGIGKTMTALDFALKLKDKIKQEQKQDVRIIYALPFINIIEQALDEYHKTLKNSDAKILGHYQYADIFGEEKKHSGEDEEVNYNQKLMALDTWQADIVITSFVQFFETLISNRNKLLKKFNHFAQAIIILDEVQTLRLDHMPLLGASLYFLSKFLKSRVVLMTATRPKIFELAQKEILSKLDEQVHPKELLTNYEDVFAQFRRTSIHPLLQPLEEENVIEDFISSIFSSKWNKKKSCLIVCNSVSFSIQLFEKIQTFLDEHNLENPAYYLSTNIVPAHRFQRIEAIKKDLKNNKCPILIATQVIEAGVDLDFDMGFRDVGPIDSIVQVAGRINRNNHFEKTNAPLYVLDFDKKKTIRVYGRLAYQQARKALGRQIQFKESEYLILIESYFDGISDKSSFESARRFFRSIKTLNYDNDDKETCPVSAFRIIEESNFYTTVFIETDADAEEIRQKYLEKITGKLAKESFNRDWKLKFQQHIISVPTYLCKDLEPINDYEENIMVVPNCEIGQTYFLTTGFNRESQDKNSSLTF